MDFLAAYVLTIAIEACALFALLRKNYGAALIAGNAVLASSLTLPFLWFAFPALGLPWGVQTALAEAFAVVAEAGIYRAAFRGMAWKDAFLASVCCNWLSFIIGIALI